MGLEPTTPCLQSRCSSQLSYVPGGLTKTRSKTWSRGTLLVMVSGIVPEFSAEVRTGAATSAARVT